MIVDETGPGHVFVVQGRIEHLDHDAMILPTDRAFSVTDIWRGALGETGTRSRDARRALRPGDWAERGWGRARPADGFAPVSPTWFVDAADSSRGAAAAHMQADLMLVRVKAALTDIARSDLPVGSRPRPLVALPTLGVGRGGFGGVRGFVVEGLLTTCQAAAAELGLDIVLVAFQASDYSAFQQARRGRARHVDHIGETRVAEAKALADRARDGSLALFVAAGVSVGAGLPTWDGLLSELAGEHQADLEDLPSALDKAEYLRRRLGDDLGKQVAAITSRTTRYGLAHALLAALRCREVVTTNYDRLYERAASDAGSEPTRVLPYEDPVPRSPWVLKMHGDAGDPRSIVLSRSDFVGYDSRSRPMGSVVQSLLLTRHLLIVGASMTDDNFLRLAHEVMAFQTESRRHGHLPAPVLGTVVSLRPSPAAEKLWEGRFAYLSAADAKDAPVPDAARRLAVFLDAVAMYAAPAHHLADPRYGYLLAGRADDLEAAAACRALAAKLASCGPEWKSLREVLEEVGAQAPIARRGGGD